MTVKTIHLDAASVRLGIKIKVRGLKGLGLRLRMARALFSVAGFVAGVPVEVDIPDARRRVLLDEEDRRIDRRAGCVYVSTHAEEDESGQRWPTWERIKLPN